MYFESVSSHCLSDFFVLFFYNQKRVIRSTLGFRGIVEDDCVFVDGGGTGIIGGG